MPRNAALIVAMLSLFSIAPISGAVALPANTLTILPADCTVRAGEELPLVLNGFSPDMVVRWDASKGGITSVLPGSNAVFVAPPEAASVTISVSIVSPGQGAETVVTQQCTVTSIPDAPRGVAHTRETEIAAISTEAPLN